MMKAVFYTGGTVPWVVSLGEERIWPLLPMGNRPLLEYWLDLCVALGISEIYLILGDGGVRIEQFAGQGSRWGVDIKYTFIREGEDPLSYLKRLRAKWTDGLLFCSGPFFQVRSDGFDLNDFVSKIEQDEATVFSQTGPCRLLISKSQPVIDKFIDGDRIENDFSSGTMRFLYSFNDFYQLNMELVGGLSTQYVTPGYFSKDGNYVGYNVQIPSAVQLNGPLNIGNNSRFSPLCQIGPNVVIGDQVVVDKNTEISDSIIMEYTYLGRSLEIRNKIVCGSRIIDPEDGTCLDLEDSWVVSSSRGQRGWASLQRALGWCFTLGFVAILMVPFLLLYGLLLFSRQGRFEHRTRLLVRGEKGELLRFVVLERGRVIRWFMALSLDRMPLLFKVLGGKLHLCGQPILSPNMGLDADALYWPGVFSYADYQEELRGSLAAEYYRHFRSLREDVKIFFKATRTRFKHALKGDVFTLG